jgi:hypothetical protein
MMFLEEWFFKMTFIGTPLIKILLSKCWPIQDTLTGQMVCVGENTHPFPFKRCLPVAFAKEALKKNPHRSIEEEFKS